MWCLHTLQLLVTTEDGTGGPFPAEIALDPQTKALASIPLALFYPLVLAAAAGAGFLGSVIGRGAPGEGHHAAAMHAHPACCWDGHAGS